MPEFITLIEKHGITSEQPQQRGKRRQETTIAGGPRCSRRASSAGRLPKPLPEGEKRIQPIVDP